MPKPPQSIATAFEDLKADFRMAKDSRFVSRLTGVHPLGSGQDYHYRIEIQWLRMIERARHYQRNDQVVGQGIRRVVANIVQDGFRHDPQTGDPDSDKMIRDDWKGWSLDADQCHSEGEMTFPEQEAMALSTIICDGDTFCMPLADLTLQWIEAHRCRTPRNTQRNCVHGVLMNDQAKRIEYWFTKENLNPYQPLAKVSDITPYPIRDKTGNRNIFHLYMPYRFSQRRGLTFIAPCSDTVGMHDDVQFATLVKAQAAALVAILHERDKDWEPVVNPQKGPTWQQDSRCGYTRQIDGYAAGLEVFGDPGEKLNMASPQVPSAEFFPHTMALLTFIAINLDIPVHVLLLDPSRTNFSGWRGAIDQARIRFKQIQAFLRAKFHTPVYTWWLGAKIGLRPSKSGPDPRYVRLFEKLGPAIFNHRWNPPQFAYIEPLTDITADDMEVSRLLNSRRRNAAAHGRDFPELRDESLDDNASVIRGAIERANAINQEFPKAAVDWREIISIPMADKATAALQLAGQRQANDQSTARGRPGNGNGPDDDDQEAA